MKIELLSAPRRQALLVTETRVSTSISGRSAGYNLSRWSAFAREVKQPSAVGYQL